MRVTYNELMQRLGTGHVLAPYETRPWYFYDENAGITCSAEVRIGPGAQDVEAEIQFLYDEREDEDEKDGDGGKSGDVKQMVFLRAMPTQDGMWNLTIFRVKSEDFMGKIFDWESRGCQFFLDCIQSIQMNELPDIEDMIENELHDATGRGGRGRVGKKAPKVNQAALLGMKR